MHSCTTMQNTHTHTLTTTPTHTLSPRHTHKHTCVTTPTHTYIHIHHDTYTQTYMCDHTNTHTHQHIHTTHTDREDGGSKQVPAPQHIDEGGDGLLRTLVQNRLVHGHDVLHTHVASHPPRQDPHHRAAHRCCTCSVQLKRSKDLHHHYYYHDEVGGGGRGSLASNSDVQVMAGCTYL